MNKLQEAVLRNIYIYGALGGEGLNPFSDDLRAVRTGEPIKLIQNEDFSKTLYTVYIYGEQIEKCEVITKSFTEVIPRENLDNTHKSTITGCGYRYIFDFDNKVESIRLDIKNNLCDPIIIPIEYKEADRDLYKEKIKEAQKQALLNNASISLANGSNLVNIYFQPCNDSYKRTEIVLFRNIANEPKEAKWQRLVKLKIEQDVFYHSITGLAYGNYAFVLKQFSNKDELLIETEKIPFYFPLHEVKRWR